MKFGKLTARYKRSVDKPKHNLQVNIANELVNRLLYQAIRTRYQKQSGKRPKSDSKPSNKLMTFCTTMTRDIFTTHMG
jgi:hypothetical protein